MADICQLQVSVLSKLAKSVVLSHRLYFSCANDFMVKFQ